MTRLLRRTLFVLCMLSLGSGSLAYASDPPSEPDTPHVRAHSIAPDRAPGIDGHLDEPVWDDADAATRFRQQEPVEGGPPSVDTEVRVLYTPTALYLGVTMHHHDPDVITARKLRRDEGLGSDDRLMWILDPYNDGRSAFFFETNPAGLRGDGLLTAGQGGSLNKSWDGIWTIETVRTGEGWTAEIRIPFRSLQFDPARTTWGFNVQRTVRVRNEEILWAGHARDEGLFRPRFAGEIRGLRGLSQGLGMDVTPYALGRSDQTWSDGSLQTQRAGDVGGEAAYAVTPTLRAAVSVNTDFAEVEVDERRVNLTRFAERFPEQRDFFLATSNIFEFAPRSAQYPFFSRRVGLVDGQPVPILAGARLGGRVGNTEVGFFQVRTRDADLQSSAGSSLPAEDITAARVVQNVGAESQIGAIYTRRGTAFGTDAPADVQPRHTLGADLELGTSEFFGDQNLQFQAFFVWHTAATGDAASAWGHRSTRGLRLNFPNDPWFGHVSYREFGNAYDPAVGFVFRNNFRRLQPTVGYAPTLETHPWIRELRFDASLEYLTDLALEPQTVDVAVTPIGMQLERGDRMDTDVARTFERLNAPFDILGTGRVVLPPGTYTTHTAALEVQTADYRVLSGRAEVRAGQYWSGTRTTLDTRLTVRPLQGVDVSAEWEHTRARLPQGDFDTHVLRFDGDLDLTTELGLSTQVQYDNLTERIGLFTRLRWILRPGSDLFLVYSHNWQRLGDRFAPQSSSGAAKISYTIRI